MSSDQETHPTPLSRSATVHRYGHAGVLVDLGLGSSPTRTELTLRAQAALSAAFPEADVVSGVGSVCVFKSGAPIATSDVLEALDKSAPTGARGTLHKLPILYDGDDLLSASATLRLSQADLIAAHSSPTYSVELIGFLPGFGYLGPLPQKLVLPRRASPRSRVSAGTLAMAANYTGIYPFNSPGGWHLLGRSLGPPLFDPSRATPFLLRVGDQVSFQPIRPKYAASLASLSHHNRTGHTLDISLSVRRDERPYVTISRLSGLVTVQDEGRPGKLAMGLPPSGPLAPGRFRRANAALQLPLSMPALEVFGGTLEAKVFGRPHISISGAEAFRPDEGELVVVDARLEPHYLAINRGFQVPRLLGSHSTHLVAGFGGFRGRALRTGDVLFGALDDDESLTTPSAEPPPHPNANREAIGITPGPHAEQFTRQAWDTLLSTTYTVSPQRDRTGTRLLGAPLNRASLDLHAPIPMIQGAIQVPADGLPIVLGPDHPVTGGYPVIAVVHPESLDTLALARPNEGLRFRWLA